jgi:hypothetical protein
MKNDSTPSGPAPNILAFAIVFLPLLVWFVYQAHFYATHIRIGLPPDELHHYNLALFYKEAPGIFLTASEKTYPYGPVDYHPYLYHLLVGKLLLLNFLQLPESLLLRHVSILCSIGTLCALWVLLSELQVTWLAKLVAMTAITNVTMFVYISSAISYDGFINLLSVVLQLSFIRALREPTWTRVIICSICLLAGSLSKITFLPFYPILAVIAAICYRPSCSALRTIWSRKLGLKEMLLVCLAGLLLLGNLHLYGGNYLKFGTVMPNLDQVVGEEIAHSVYAQARRDKALAESRESRADMSLSEFLPKYFNRALQGIFGIMGHGSFDRQPIEMWRFYLTGIPALVGGVVFLMLLVFGRESSPKEVKRALLIVSLFSTLYITFVALYNFKSFQAVRLFGYALQGRYLFPVLCSFLAACAFFSFYRIRSLKVSLPLAAVIVVVYLKQGLWSFVERLQQIGLF